MLTAAPAIVYVALAPPSPDLAAAELPQRPVRRGRLYAVGQRLVRRAPPAGLLAAARRRSARCSGRACSAALSMTVATALFARVIDGRFARARRASAARGSRSARRRRCCPAASPFDLGVSRSALGARCSRAQRAARDALALALACVTLAREPGRRRVPRARAVLALERSPGAPRALARARAGRCGARSRRSRCSRSRSPKAGRSRSSPRPSTRRSRRARARAAARRAEQRALRAGAPLYALALIGAFVDPDARSAATSTGSGRWWRPPAPLSRALAVRRRGADAAAAAPGAARCSRRCCSTGRPTRRSPTSPRRPATRPCSASYYRRCSASCARSASATTRARRASRCVPTRRPLGGALGRAAGDARPRLGAPARPQAQRRSSTTAAPLTRRALPRVAARAGGLATSRCPTRRWTTPRKAEARLLRAGPPGYLREVWRSRALAPVRVLGATPLAQPPARADARRHDSFALRAPRAGHYVVRVRFTPYWALAAGGGCVRARARRLDAGAARGARARCGS